MAVGQPGEHVERGAGDGAGALGGDAGLGERLRASRWCSASMSTVVSTPSARMPRSSHSAGDPGAGADLDDRAGVEDRGEEAQRGAAAGADRGDPDLLGAGAGGGEDLVLGDEGLGVGPARGLDRGGDGGLLGRAPTR